MIARRVAIAVALTALVACEREARRFREEAAANAPVTMSAPSLSFYEENAYAMAEGKRLFMHFNCVGCHANGGGGMGPALMDAKWLYGSEPHEIFRTIVEGRPNGMPSFRGKIATFQVWQLVSYVRSLSGQVRKDAAPGRADHMSVKEPELRKTRERPEPVR